ncbi:hypothetical protein SAMN04487905_11389 [Actinopolyspora xinjiangensis]|uniref:Ketoreductase domain-containing protein n=1 Tax=Actinopolyspora xinjiangensis TaxID=405564 RepID=A0A1H0WNI7_9ACTN|nr:SDR family NAD(P)-dependent oxidoreductase [Actinopolyspora xinjiangensis]SDP92223.1 hypothetical protein SAMN04487905_11389 [Actinopolyspora xinjiangensis]
MRSGLDGRRVLLTGGSSGIGAATARALAERGCELILVGRHERTLRHVAEATGARAVAADLSVPGELTRVAERATDADVLINNAGVGWAGRFTTMSGEEVHRLLTVNLAAPLELTRLMLPAMRQRGGGHVVFVSSIAAVGVGDEAVYSATKAGLRAFAAGLRQETNDSGVVVTTILPGAVRTPFFRRRGRPYERGFPRQVSAELVASRTVRAIERGGRESFVPRWLGAAARIQGGMPTTFERLNRLFGGRE